MAEPGELGGSKPQVTKLPVVSTRPSTTYNSYSPPIKYTTGVTPGSTGPNTVSSKRVGDYIVSYRNGVEISRKYDPIRNTATGGSTVTKIQGTTSGQANTGGTSGGTGGYPTSMPTAGGAPVGGASGGGAPGGAGASAVDVGKLYGYTSGLSPNDVMAGIQYPTRVLNDVLGSQASPTTTGLMNPWMDMAANPWALYLMNSANAGTDMSGAPTQSDTYNFIANLLSNAMTPGASVPGFGQILQNLATALSSANSPVYGGIFGDTLGAAGLDSPGSVMRNLEEAISGFGMSMNPLAAQNLGSLMGLMQNDYLSNYDVNSPQGMENPATYILRRLGINANIPNNGPSPTGA